MKQLQSTGSGGGYDHAYKKMSPNSNYNNRNENNSNSNSIGQIGDTFSTPSSSPSSPSPSPVTLSLSNDRNFLCMILELTKQPIPKPWFNLQQYYHHIEIKLLKSIELFNTNGLIFLGERSTTALINQYRKTGQIRKMGIEYEKLSQTLLLAYENGDLRSSYGMGTFYWVQFAGKGKYLYISYIIII